MASDLTKSGTEASGPSSRPSKVTSTASRLTPAVRSSRASPTPAQRALPIAPCRHWAPGTLGPNRPRELPEH